jgi:GNAT superfamily N-acetyltransferase
MALSLREAGPTDSEVIAHIHAASWRDAYTEYLAPSYLEGEVEQERLAVWSDRFAEPAENWSATLALAGDDSVGFVCTFGAADDQWGALLDNLHVLPDARSKGTGAALLHSAQRWVAGRYPGSGMYLWVFETNFRARSFYERHGGQLGERGISYMPTAPSAPVLRVYWTAERLKRCVCE